MKQPARERDPVRREAILHDIQKLTIERAMFAPVMDRRAPTGIGPRIVKHTIGYVWMSAFPSHANGELSD